MGKHSSLLQVEYLRLNKARQKRAFFNQFMLGVSPLVVGALIGAGVAERGHAQAVNLDPTVHKIIPDGRTRTTITTTGTHSRITTDTVSGNVGFNTFSDFQQAAGTRVDLFVPDAAGSLVNIVSNGAVVIHGELNGYKDGSIGGNIFFSSSDGFIVGEGGRINVGSLTVNTPTPEFLNRVVRADGTVNDAVAAQLMRGEIPMSPNGHIAIMGKVNAKGSITLQGHTVTLTGDTGPLTGEDLGQRTKFDATVNSTGMIEGGALVAFGGRIAIVAKGGSRIGGRVEASAPTPTETAGTVSITGGDITVEGGAVVAANGDAGGEIVVFADGTLAVQDGATFNAAGIGSGDGGFIELSGRDAHIGSVNLDLSSRVGRAGTLLIDPFNLFIGGASTSSSFTSDISTSPNILSNGANIVLEADNSITVVNGGILDSRMMTGELSSGNSGNITLEAPTIVLEDGSRVLAGVTTGSGFTGGNVTFTATRTNGGTAEIVIGQGGVTGPVLTGNVITFSATSTANAPSILVSTPTATARITATSGSITAAGSFSASATATGNGGVTLLPLGIVVTNVTSLVDIGGSTQLSAASATLAATSTVISSLLTQSLAPANAAADGAVAVNTINSTAIVRIGGASVVGVTGATSLTATNSVTSTSDATPQAAAFGASVGVSVVNAVTTAEIVDAASVTAGALSMDAITLTDITVKAVAGAGGATTPSPGSQATTYLTDAKYGGQASTDDGAVSVAGALAISDLTSTTNARINTTVATTVTGALALGTMSGNKATVTADASMVSSATGVGVALGINIAKVVNDAVISSAVNAASASLSALRPAAGNAFVTTATSGAGATNVGLAGSFALNLIDTQSVARVAGASVVTVAGGAVALSSDNATTSTASALPKDDGAGGATVGVGAGIAMNIVANRSSADVANGGTVTGAGALTLSALATHVATTKAEAGSAGGVSIMPALALSLINNTTMARLGAGGTQTVAGAVSVSAAQHSTVTTEASGKAAGSKAAIGAAVALALVDDRALATTARSVTASGAVSFRAAGASLSSLKAEASAVGAADDAGAAPGGGDIDTTTTSTLTKGSEKQKASGVGDADQQAATDTAAADEDGRSASTSEGKVSVAAAVSINVQTSSVTAAVPDGVVISAGGVLTLAAINNTDGKIEAVGDAVGKADAEGVTPPASQVGIGAAVAVNVVKTRNDAVLGNAAHGAGGLSVSATKRDVAAFMADPSSTAVRGDVYLAKASSGAGASKVGIAGSVALNLLDTQSVARVAGGSVVITGSGAVSLSTDNRTSATAEALPVGAGAVGATVGIGASVALNILANRSVAEVADGVVLTGPGDLTLAAAATHVAVTKAEAGSAGGVSITPALALSLINNTTTARLGTGGTQTVAGAVSISATQSSLTTTEASGKAAGSTAAIGASLALAIVDDRVLATTARNINASGAVSFTASGISSSTLTSVASAAGAKDADDADAAPASTGESVDKSATTEFKSGADRQQKSGVGDSSQRGAANTAANDEGGRSAETSEGKVAVAAAVAINVQSSEVRAVVPDGVSITAGGAITVASAATTSGLATSDGQAVKGADGGTSQVGIGVAVSVNVVKEINTAYLGAAVHAGAGFNVRALQAAGAATDNFLASATSGAGGSKVGIAGSVALNIVTLNTTARVAGGAAVLLGAGASTVQAANAVSATAKAIPSDEGVTGGQVGVGASFAMNLITTTTVAEVQNGATLTAGTGLAVSATSGLDTTTEAAAGAAGGIAVDASVALALLNQTTEARIGAGNALTMGAGAVSVIAANTGANIAKSTGENKADKVGVGASASVILGNGESGGALNNTSKTTAILARGATAGSVTISASAQRTYDANATATAGGGLFSDTDEKKNDKTGGTSTSADSLDKTKDSQRDGDGNSSGAKVTIAAAAGIAAAQDVVTARFEGGTLNASGAVSITSTNSVGMTASGIGVAKDPGSKVGIGVGVGLAILNNTTSATIGNGAVITNAAGLTVAATSRENADGPYRSKLSALGIAGASGKNVAVAGSLAVAISTGKTEAKIGSNVTVGSGGAMSIAVDNESQLSAKAVAGSVSTSGVAVGGSIAVVVSQKEYESSVGANSTLTGSALSVTAINRKIDSAPDFDFLSLDDLEDFADSLSGLLTMKILGNSNYYAEAIGGAGGSGAAVQGSFAVMVFSDKVNASIGANATVNAGTGTVTLSSDADHVAKAISGALAASTSSAGVGVSSTVIVSSGETVSKLDTNARVTSAGSFVNTARASQDIRTYAASASAASSAGVSGVAGVITSGNRVEALMQRGARVTISGNGAVSLGATNTFKVFGLAAGIGVGGTAGVGAAATVVVVNNTTRAAIADGTSAADRGEINASGAISITATATEDGDLFSVAGAAGGTAGVGAGAGIYVLGTMTEARAGNFAKVGNAFNSGSLTVRASDLSRLFAVSGAAGVGGTAGVGAGIAVGVLNKAITAEIGVSANVKAGNVIVDAKSGERISNITAGVGVGGTAGLAGAVTVLAINPVTTARIGASARVFANGNVAVLADGKTEISMIEGAFGVGGTAGVGASIGVAVVGGSTQALVDNNAQVTALGNGAAQAYTTGYQAGLSNYGANEGFSAPDFNPGATNELTEADAAAARTAGLGLLTQNRTSTPTTATARGVIVNASGKVSQRALSVAGAAGTVGVSVSAGVPVITTVTRAQIGNNAQINLIAGSAGTAQNVVVAAASDLYALGFAGSVAGGAVGVGAGVSVMVLSSTTEALVGTGGTMTAQGDVAVSAVATQDVVGIGAAGSVGTVGVSGGVSVMVLNTKTKAHLGGTVTAQGNVDVIADDRIRTSVLAGALAVGYVGVGAAVSVVSLNREIDARILNGSSVSAFGLRGNHAIFTGADFGSTRSTARGVNVQSNSSQSGFTLGVAGSGGAVGVSGVVTLYLMDVKNTAAIGDNVSINTSGGNAGANAAQDVAVTARDETVTSVAAGGIAVGLFAGVSGAVDVGIFKNTAAASIGDNVTLNTARDVFVAGLSNKAGEAYVISASGGIVGVAAGIAIYSYGDGVAPGGEADKNIGEASESGTLSLASITNDAQSQARNGVANDQLQASDDARVKDVSNQAQVARNAVDLTSAVSTLSIPAGTSANIGSGTINAGGTVGVNSSDKLNVKMVTGAVAVGAVGGGAGVGVLTVDTGSTAQIDGTGTLAAGSVTVRAVTDHTLKGLHFAGAGGLLAAISADVGILTDNSRTTAQIKRKAISTGGALAVNANSTRNVTVDAIGVSVAGTLAVGASVGQASIGGSVLASVSDGASIGSLAARAGSLSVTATSNATANTKAVAVGGGIGAALQGAGSIAKVRPSVTASVTSAQIATSGLSNINASATGSARTEAIGVAVAGGLAVGASAAESEVSSAVATTITGSSIDAGSLTIGSQVSAGQVRSYAAGAAGALIGVNATVANARNTSGAVTTVTTSGIVAAGAATISATATSNQDAEGTGLAGGLVAAGFNRTTATSNTTTIATLTNLTNLSAGSLNITATGTDTNKAVTVAGSGGVIAGSAASASTSSASTTRAGLDTTGAASFGANVAGNATIAAQHTANFAGSVDSTQASVAGASGANIGHSIVSTVDAKIGDRVQLTARNVTLSSRNITDNPFLSGYNVKSISSGLVTVPAGGATVVITHNTTATVGASAIVRLTRGAGPSLFKQEAYNDITSKQKVNLDSGGLIAVANAEIDAVITANATSSVGAAGKVEVDYGDIQIAAWGEADFDVRSSATTYGLAGAPSGDANITYTGANTVSVGNDALVQATDGDTPTNGDLPRYATITIGAGAGPAGQTANLKFNATVDIFNKTAIPIPSAPNPTVIVANSGLVTVGTTASLNMNVNPQGVRAAGDIRISASKGNIDARAVGTGKDIYREALAKAASAISNAFGGGDVSFDYHGGSTNTGGGIARVDVNGRIETGIQRTKTLTLDLLCDAGTGSCIATSPGDNIEFGISGPFPVGTEILARVAELAQLIIDYDTDPIAKAAYRNEINFLHKKLVGLGLGSFNALGEFAPGTFAGPSQRALLQAQAAATANNISAVKVQLGVVAPTAVVASLSELVDGVGEFYTEAGFGLNTTVPATVTTIQSMSTYGTTAHINLVNTINTLRTQGSTAATTARNAEADVIALRNSNIARAAEIATAQAALETALLSGNAASAAIQQGIISTAQTTIANNLATINTKVADITTQTAIARDRAAQLNTNLTSLLNSIPLNPVEGSDAQKADATAKNNSDNAKRAALTAPGSPADFYAGAGSLTRVGLTQTSITSTVGDLAPVLTSINSAVATLRADTGTTPGTVGSATNSLTQIVGLLTSLTTAFTDTTIQAAAAPASSGIPESFNIDVADTATRLGNIFITGEQLRTNGTGQLLAPGDATIQITNNTHHTLKLGNLYVPTYDAGNVRFNGVLVYSAANITSLNAGGLPSGFANLNVVTSRTSSRGLVEIRSTYTPAAISNVADRKIAPDIILKRGSVIENINGAVRIISEAGNIYTQGTINAGSVEILAKDGDFVASYVNGFNHIGGDPASFTVHTSTTEPGPGITANGAISISARYLNINSTIQSGVAQWNLTLNANPTLTASASAIGVSDAALAAANAINATTVVNSQGQTITINRAPDGIDPVELSLVVNQYKDEVIVNANADPVRTISIFGVPTQVNIKDYLSEQVGISLRFTNEQAAAYATATGTDGIYSVVRTSATDNIGASYDAKNGQYFVNGTAVKGGYIQLFGQIMNTSASTSVGRLNVLDGFGTININNTSNIPVVLRNLSTGEDPNGTLRGVEGLIEITDVIGVNALNPSNPVISVRKTVFTRDYVPGNATGVVRIATQVGTIDNATGNLILGGTINSTGGDRTTTYAPGPNQRYVWTTAEEYSRTSKYQQVSTQLFGSASLTVASVTSLTLNGAPLLGATIRLSDGTYVTTVGTITGGGLEIVNGAAFQNPAATVSSNPSLAGTQMTTANQSTFTKNEFVKTGESSRRCNWWTLCIASKKTYYYELRQEYTTIVTESLKADYLIGVNFIGSNTGAINVTSTASDVVLTSNINAAAGTVTINAGTTLNSGASIIQGDLAAEIKAKTISLTADRSVGGVTDLLRVGAPVNHALTVNLTGTTAAGFGALSANAKNGNVAIISRANLVVDQVTASGSVSAGRGTVNLFSFASIDGKDQTARIQAPRVTLTALGGSVGNTANGSMLRVNSGFSTNPADRPFGDPVADPSFDPNALLGTTITATGDIGVRSDGWSGNTAGTVLAVKVQSTGGNVRINATGQILDNNPVQTIDQRTYDELLGFWESLGLLAEDTARDVDGSVNQAKQENAILAFENSTTQTYNQYWRIRGDNAYDASTTVTVAPGSAQFRALDAQFRDDAVAAGITDPTAQNSFVAARIADVETQQTVEYHRLHAVVGDLTASYDAAFVYVATDAQKAELTRGSVWTERELAFSLAPGALKTVTGTNPVLKDPNVSGRTVTIEAGLGIGETIGAGTGSLGVSIRSDLDPRNLTLDQKVALAAAERNDLLLTVGPVNLPAGATAEQIAAYNAAVALGLGAPGALTSLNLGAEFDTLTTVQQAALNAAAIGLVSPANTLLTVLSKRPLNFNAVTALNLTVPNVSSGSNADIGGAFVASRGGATLGQISTFGDTRIKVFGDIINAPGSVVQTGNLILEAAQGRIGSDTTPLTLTPRGTGVTTATTTARAQNGVNVAFVATGRIDTVYSPQNVKLLAQNSLLNAQDDELINVLGAQVDLRAVTGSIGTAARSLNVGVQIGGQIVAVAQQEINLFGSAGTRFIIGSANAGGTIRLAAAGEGVIDGLVQTPGDILIATGGRTLFTALGDAHSVAGLVDINSGSLKMLNGAVIRTGAGRVAVATIGDALVTGITSASALANSVSVTAGGRIFAGTSDPRTDITAMTAGAGVVLTAGLGIGDRTQANDTALDNTVTDPANPLRIRTNTLAATATDGAISLLAQTNMTMSALSAPKGTITVNGIGTLAIGTAQSRGSQSFTAQDALTYISLVTTGLPAVPGPADPGDITVTSLASTVIGTSLDAAGSAKIEGTSVTYTDVKTGKDATILARTGGVTGGDLTAGGNASITGATTVDVTNVEVTGTSTILANGGAATVGDIITGGDSSITGASVDVTKAKVGGSSTTTAYAGAIVVGDLDADGSSEMTGTGITVTTVKTGLDSTLTGGTGQVRILTSLNAGGTSTITGNGVFFDTIIAGRDSIIFSTSDIIGELEHAGETITNVAGFGDGNTGILDVKIMRAKNINLQATGTLVVGVVEVAENLTLRADVITALDITQVPDGPNPLNITLTGANGGVATLATINVKAPAGVVMPDVIVSETVMTTTAQFVQVVNGIVPIQGTSPMAGTFLLTTPSQTVFVDDRSQTPKGNPPSNTQFFLDGNPFTMTLNGTTTATNSFVVIFDATVQVTDVLGVPFQGISLVRDTIRQMRDVDDGIRLPGAFGTGSPGFFEDDEDPEDTLDVSDLDDTVVEIDGIAYNVIVRGSGPTVLVRQ